MKGTSIAPSLTLKFFTFRDAAMRTRASRRHPTSSSPRCPSSSSTSRILPSMVCFVSLVPSFAYMNTTCSDLEFVKTFMLTYENFTTPRNLFKLLIRRYSCFALTVTISSSLLVECRYFMEPPAHLEGTELDEWIKSVQVRSPAFVVDDAWIKADHAFLQSPTRLRVCNVIKMWMEKCSLHLQSDDHLLTHIHKFASKVVTGNMSQQLLRLVQQVRFRKRGRFPSTFPPNTHLQMKQQGGAREPTSYQFSRQPPYPEVPNSFNAIVGAALIKPALQVPKNLFSPSLKVWDISELELARQLTIMEFNCFTKIQV